jgi:FkbH-like protein
MKYYLFRNYTVEAFFKGADISLSGYGDVSFIDEAADRYIWFYVFPYKINTSIIADELKHYSNLLDLVISNINSNKEIFIFTLYPLFQIRYQILNTDIADSVSEYNRKIYLLAQNNVNIKVVDILNFYNRFSPQELIDWKYFYVSQMPVNPKLAANFSQWFLHQTEIIEMKRKKCIIVDLDNTLWAGILGEDGANGIKMAGDYPGNTFHLFQEYLLELKRIGIIIAICSKNNEADTLDIIEKHPDMLLRKQDIAAYRINWNNKADNIKEIADELNIGLDSIVFIDDNPSERELIKQMLPDVSVPDFPIHPYHYPEFIKNLTDDYFCTYKLTEEDLSKTRQYQENAERMQYEKQFADIDTYLRSLNIELTVEQLNEFNSGRLAQLTQKTSQFNLTTHRYTEADLQLLSDQGSLIFGLRVKDRFGDNGLTGLIIVKTNERIAAIDTFLLSCRILGRRIENEFIQYILNRLKSSNFRQIDASYVKTDKNRQVENFYESIGFVLKESLSNRKEYMLSLDKYNLDNTYVYRLEEI